MQDRAFVPARRQAKPRPAVSRAIGGEVMHRGAPRRARLPGTEQIESLISFSLNGETLAASASSLYRFSETDTPVAEGGTVTAELTGQTSSDYSTVEMQNDAGSFMTLVNGADDAVIYDGEDWHHVGGETYAITEDGPKDAQGNVTQVDYDTAKWTYGWVYQGRQYFIEKGTLDAYYLGVNSFNGVATRLPLSGVFSKSSELLFGASFSTDSGSGIDDYNVFVTKEGEVAIFAGLSPSDAATWSLKGLFEIGRPLGKNAHFSIAGDLIIGTVDGLVPLSSALQKDVSELRLFSLSAAIEPDMDLEIRLAEPFAGGRWRMAKSAFHDLGFVVLPRRDQPEHHLFVVYLFVVFYLRQRAGCDSCELLPKTAPRPGYR